MSRPSFASAYRYTGKNELLSISHVSASGANLASASSFYHETDDSDKRVAIHDGDQTNLSNGAVVPLAMGTGGTRYAYDKVGNCNPIVFLDRNAMSTSGAKAPPATR